MSSYRPIEIPTPATESTIALYEIAAGFREVFPPGTPEAPDVVQHMDQWRRMQSTKLKPFVQRDLSIEDTIHHLDWTCAGKLESPFEEDTGLYTADIVGTFMGLCIVREHEAVIGSELKMGTITIAKFIFDDGGEVVPCLATSPIIGASIELVPKEEEDEA